MVDIRERQPAPAAARGASSGAPSPATRLGARAPSVRRVAREIGVDIAQVTGQRPGGRITEDDVKEFARQIMSSLGGGALAPAPGSCRRGGPALPDFSKWGEVERKPMTGIRRKTAEHLSHAWNADSARHAVRQGGHDGARADPAEVRGRGREARAASSRSPRSSPRSSPTALKKFPQFNASIDVATESIIYKKYVHIGIAVDTEHGLLVPVVRNADQKNILQIAVEIQQLAEKAKARKLSLDEMSGGSMSITNLGGIGGTAFTPIVNWPEVAILGISRGSVEAVFKDGADRAAADAAAVAQLRPPRHRRRRCDPLPALGRRGDRAAVHVMLRG